MPLSPIQKKSIIVQQPKNLRPQEKQQSKPIINSKLNNIRAAVHSPAEKTNKHPAALFKGKIYYAGDQIKNPTGKVIYTVNPPKPVTVNGKQYYPGDQVTLKHGKAFIVPFLNLDFLDRQK